MQHSNLLSVHEALSGKNVLITGVTGFLGKSIVEKLLRQVSDIGQIYLLIRKGQSESAEIRCEEDVFSSSIFDVLRDERGAGFWKEKVTVVDGELTQRRLGMSQLVFDELGQDLDMIINSAASVNFREALDQALSINTLCLNNLCALSAVKGQDDAATPVLQISTCYVNGFNRGFMREEVVSPATGLIPQLDDDLYDIQPLIASMQEKIQRIKDKGMNAYRTEQALIKLGIQQARKYGWNDTYTFTKWLGEQLLLQHFDKKNLTFVRPSIIEGTWSEPVKGWVEGVKVADAMIYAYAKGRVSVFPGDDRGILDVIPVDLVANAVILSAAQRMDYKGQYRIYQCCSGRTNPIQLRDFISLIQDEAVENYRQYPKLFAGEPKEMFKTVSLDKFRLYMAGFKTATWLKTSLGRLVGSKKATKQMQKAKTTAELAQIFGFYTAPKYRFDSFQLEQLMIRFNREDRMKFDVQADQYDWSTYIREVHMPGLHRYALQDKVERRAEREGKVVSIKKAA